MSFSGCWFFLLIYSTTCFELFWTFQSFCVCRLATGQIPHDLHRRPAPARLCHACSPADLNLWNEYCDWHSLLCAKELTEEGLPFLILFHLKDDTESLEKFQQEVARQLISEKGMCRVTGEVNFSGQHVVEQHDEKLLLCNANFGSVVNPKAACRP